MDNFIRQFIRAQTWPKTSFPLPRLQVHRGYHVDGIQENTLAAFQKARELGAHMCECDVRLSKENLPVVVHDADLKRISGTEQLVANTSAEELKQLAGIPTLEEILTDETVTPFFNIELKCDKMDDKLPRKVAELVKNLNCQSRVMFSSFNPLALWMMQNYLPDVPRALLVSPGEDPRNRWYLRKMVLAPFLKLHMLNLQKDMIGTGMMQDFRFHEIPVAAWTVNDEANARHLMSKGVVSIISDKIIHL
jgi:glycerophosphoryl diester phosphodiesterase